MSTPQTLENIKTEIEKLAKEQIASPGIPVDDFIQEAENLYKWSLTDKEALAGAGLDVTTANT